MIKPFIVKEIKDYGKSIYKNKPVILNKKICKPETIKVLKQLLEGVVENGTANNLKALDYKVAGKTGTAQIATNGSGYNKSSHKASFVGYFPANNPQYTCIVVINAPTAGVYYGGLVAGPVFKEVADKVYSTNLSFHKPLVQTSLTSVPSVKNGNRTDIKNVLNQLQISSKTISDIAETEWVRTNYDIKSINLLELKTQADLVPNVIGMGAKDAVYLLENRGLKVIINGAGSVVQQSIPAQSKIIKGSTIYLKLSL